MDDLMMEIPETVSDARGTFRAWAMAAECGDGSWEGWLEFVPADRDTSLVYASPIEARQHDRAMIATWASGLTHVYAEGALSRARIQADAGSASQLLLTLMELVEALDRRMPQIERVGEAQIAADASRLRACAMRRIAVLRQRKSDPMLQSSHSEGTR